MSETTTTTVARLGQARTLLLFCIALWLALSARNVLLARPIMATVQAVGGVVALAAWIASRRASTERQLQVICHVGFTLSSCLMLTVAVLNGSWTTTPFLLTLIPVAAAYLLGERQAIAWAILTFAGAAVVNVVGPLGLVQTEFRAGLWEIVLGIYLPLHVVLVVIAVAARRASEAQVAKANLSERQVRAQATELEGARDAALEGSRAKGAFLATMSHELRTPLNAIIGMASVIDEANLSRDQRECIDTIRTSGETLLSLIGDILDFSKIEAGKMELELAPVELARCVDDAIDLVAAAAAKKGIEITREIAVGTPTWISTDRPRLQQVLLNLLSNAVKFTSTGDVTVGIRSRELGANDECELEIRIDDEGIGIPADKVETLFAPFRQVDASTTREYGGTGLGLAISRALVTLLGGRIWVESAVGKGSTFGVILRTRAVEGEPASEVSELRADGRPVRALVLSRHRRVRESAARQVASFGAVVTASASVPAGAAGGGWDVAVVDAGRARAEDLADAKELKRLLPHVPIILLVPLGRHEALGQPFVQTEIALTIPKPTKEARLRRAIGRAAMGEGSSARVTGKKEIDRTPDDGRRVLVADDNQVNQKVTRHLLEHLGHSVDVVSDGIEALEAVDRQTYDALFLDVQMPRLDGLETARRLVSERVAADRPRLIALTANASRDDRAACLAAGMDDYLSKPVRLGDLETAMRGVPRRERKAPPSKAAPAPSDDALLDTRVLKDLQDLEASGAAGLLASLVDSFLNDVPKRLTAIEEALARRAAHDVMHQAHTIKGSAAALGVVQVRALAARIEGAANAGDLDGLTGATSLLREELTRAEPALRRVAARAGTPGG